MRQLIQFIYRLRVFFVFVALELFASWLIIQNRNYQGYALVSSSNRLIGNMYEVSGDITAYFDLREQNAKLMRENARLAAIYYNQDTIYEASSLSDTSSVNFSFIPAHVVSNTIIHTDNYLTIDKGSSHGIKPGMGVISSSGIVGKVKVTSSQFSTVYSLLHSDVTVSAQTQKGKVLCTVKWNSAGTTNNFRKAELLYVDMQHDISKGDTIETSGYNSIYPESILVGVVDTVFKKKSEMFQQIKINLITDFSTLKNVYVIENKLREEKDSIEVLSKESYLY